MKEENRHITEYISSEICEVEKIGSGKVFALLSQNASNTIAAWHIIMDKYPHITATGRASHGLKQLFNDFMQLGTLEKIYKKKKTSYKR